MNSEDLSKKADSIINDILQNHLPRISEGLKKGYIDENQALIVYDHLVRARQLKELSEEMKKVG